MIIDLLFQNPLAYLMVAVSITLALTVHEYSHAQMADLLGDSTARDMGRLSLNPLRHLDPLGAFFIFVLGFGWGRPVPINYFNLKNKEWGPAWIGLAGPLSNFIMAVVVGLILRFVSFSSVGLVSFLSFFVWINLLLGVFNLIPVPPLDGSHILFAIMHSRGKDPRMAFASSGIFSLLIAILLMMYLGIPYIVRPLFNLITTATLF